MNLRKLALLINVLLAGLVLWMGVNIFLTWRSNPKKGPQVPPQDLKKVEPAQAVAQKPPQLTKFQTIIKNDMFSTTNKGGNFRPLQPKKEIEVTKLNLKLKGTVLRGEDTPYAIIEDGQTRKQDLYYVNNFIQGAKIVKVLSDRVILSRDGKEEALIMSFESGPAPRERFLTRSRPTRRPVQRKRTPTRSVSSRKKTVNAKQAPPKQTKEGPESEE